MSSASSEPKSSEQREKYYERIAQQRLVPLWEFFKEWFTAEPRVRSQPHLWRYDDLRALLLESATLIDPDEAERRVLVLENPGLEGRHLVTESLYAGLQLIMPTEVAPCHRHSPAALRFVIEGHGAFTSVNGEKAYMEPGDLIVTPSWAWHEHGHEGDGPTVWLDVLDVPVIHLFNATFAEQLPGRTQHRPPPVDPAYRYPINTVTAAREAPGGEPAASPVFSYPYARSREALDRLKARGEPDPCHGLKIDYVDSATGGPAIPTISTSLRLLEAGFESEPYRTTAGTIVCVVEGAGTVEIGPVGAARAFRYRPRDILVVPSWHSVVFKADRDSVLFSASDEAMQRKLGFWREQRGL